MQVNRFLVDRPLPAEQVLPCKLSLGDAGRAIFLGPFSQAGPGERIVRVAQATVRLVADVGARATPWVLIDGIVLDDGTALPTAIALAADADLGPSVAAEPVDPRSGRRIERRLGLDLHAEPVFVSRAAGAGRLLVFLLEAQDASGPIPVATLIRQVAARDDGDADAAASVTIAANVQEISVVAPGPAHVGRPFGLPIQVQRQRLAGIATGFGWAHRPDLDTSLPFTAAVHWQGTTPTTVPELRLDTIQRPFRSRWDAAEVDTDVQYDLVVEPHPPADGRRPLRVIDPDALQARGRDLWSGGRFRFDHGFGEYLLPRRPGDHAVRIDPLELAPGLAPVDRSVPVHVEAVQLILTATGDGATDGPLVLEDRWRPEEGVLVGGLDVRVSVPPVAAPDIGGERVYDSTLDSAYLAASATPGELVLTTIVAPIGVDPSFFGPWSDNVRRSFQLRLTIDDPTKAAFWIAPERIGRDGNAFYVGDLSDIVRAVGVGRTTLRVALEPLGEPLPDECVEYAMPPPVELEVEIPPPLTAELTAWEDAHFTSRRRLALDAPRRDVIFRHGTVHGRVAEHRPGSTSERIALRLERPDGDPVPPADHADGSLDLGADGAVAHALRDPVSGELAWTSASGVNRFELSAWKPIHDVLGLGPSVAVGTVTAVLPAVPDVAFDRPPGDGAAVPNVVVRALPAVRWSLELATSGALEVTGPDGGRTTLESDAAIAYLRRGKRTTGAQLTRRVGVHAVGAVARNDFGRTFARAVEVRARAPELDVRLSVPTGYAGKFRTPHDVGHSVLRVIGTATMRWALGVGVAGDGATDVQHTPRDPFRASDLEVDLPEAGDLTIGFNAFSFAAENEFAATAPSTQEVHRRGEVYDVRFASVSLIAVGDNRFIHARVIFDGRVVREEAATSRLVHTETDQRERPTPLGFDRIEFEILREDEDDDLVRASCPLEVSVATNGLVGPDFERLVALIEVPPSRVVDDAEDNVHVRDDLWLQVTLADSSDGDIPLIVVED